MSVTTLSRKKSKQTSRKSPAPTAKEAVREILKGIPDNASFEDIQYHIYVRQKIALALEDVEAGRVVSQEEAERRMAKWLEE